MKEQGKAKINNKGRTRKDQRLGWEKDLKVGKGLGFLVGGENERKKEIDGCVCDICDK